MGTVKDMMSSALIVIYSATYTQHMVCIVLCGSRHDFPVQQQHVLFVVQRLLQLCSLREVLLAVAVQAADCNAFCIYVIDLCFCTRLSHLITSCCVFILLLPYNTETVAFLPNCNQPEHGAHHDIPDAGNDG